MNAFIGFVAIIVCSISGCTHTPDVPSVQELGQGPLVYDPLVPHPPLVMHSFCTKEHQIDLIYAQTPASNNRKVLILSRFDRKQIPAVNDHLLTFELHMRPDNSLDLTILSASSDDGTREYIRGKLGDQHQAYWDNFLRMTMLEAFTRGQSCGYNV